MPQFRGCALNISTGLCKGQGVIPSGLVANFRRTLEEVPRKIGHSNTWASGARTRACAHAHTPASAVLLGTVHPGSVYSVEAKPKGFVSGVGLAAAAPWLLWVGAQAQTRVACNRTPTPTRTGGLHGRLSAESLGARREAESPNRFRVHKGDILGLQSIDLFARNRQRMESRYSWVTTMRIWNKRKCETSAFLAFQRIISEEELI